MVKVIARNITVDFPIYGADSRSLKKTFIRAATGGLLARDAADRIVVRALDDVSFELHEGDRLGVIGHNGAGKSTLLRVIAGAYKPIRGSLTVCGKISSMLSISLGVDLEATGYENIYLRGAVMGLKRSEISALMDEIVAFSELGDYINMPVRTYSSGMAMRLAFAISTSVSADIILMDEWLSAGDASFSEKAQRRLKTLLSQAKILVLASHDESLISKNCNKIVRLDHGALVALGGANQVPSPVSSES